MSTGTVRVAVIGAGHWGPNLIRNFHNRPRSEVVTVVDTNEQRLERVRTAYPDVCVSTNPEDAFRDDSVHAVVIATPTATHYDLASRALAVGKHVLVEKPITTDVKEGEALGNLAEQARKILMVGHVFLFNGAVQFIKRTVDAGDVGRIYSISMARTNLGPIRVDVNAAWDLASHDISIADYLLGRSAISASATGGSWINPGVEDAVFAVLQYPNGVLVNIHCSWLNPRKVRDITIVGERKMLTFDDMNISEPIRIYDKQVADTLTQVQLVDTFAAFRASVREGDVLIPRVAAGEPLRQECEHFLSCIAENKRPLTDAKAATAVVRTLEAIDRSMKNGGRQEPV